MHTRPVHDGAITAATGFPPHTHNTPHTHTAQSQHQPRAQTSAEGFGVTVQGATGDVAAAVGTGTWSGGFLHERNTHEPVQSVSFGAARVTLLPGMLNRREPADLARVLDVLAPRVVPSGFGCSGDVSSLHMRWPVLALSAEPPMHVPAHALVPVCGARETRLAPQALSWPERLALWAAIADAGVVFVTEHLTSKQPHEAVVRDLLWLRARALERGREHLSAAEALAYSVLSARMSHHRRLGGLFPPPPGVVDVFSNVDSTLAKQVSDMQLELKSITHELTYPAAAENVEQRFIQRFVAGGVLHRPPDVPRGEERAAMLAAILREYEGLDLRTGAVRERVAIAVAAVTQSSRYAAHNLIVETADLLASLISRRAAGDAIGEEQQRWVDDLVAASGLDVYARQSVRAAALTYALAREFSVRRIRCAGWELLEQDIDRFASWSGIKIYTVDQSGKVRSAGRQTLLFPNPAVLWWTRHQSRQSISFLMLPPEAYRAGAMHGMASSSISNWPFVATGERLRRWVGETTSDINRGRSLIAAQRFGVVIDSKFVDWPNLYAYCQGDLSSVATPTRGAWRSVQESEAADYVVGGMRSFSTSRLRGYLLTLDATLGADGDPRGPTSQSRWADNDPTMGELARLRASVAAEGGAAKYGDARRQHCPAVFPDDRHLSQLDLQEGSDEFGCPFRTWWGWHTRDADMSALQPRQPHPSVARMPHKTAVGGSVDMKTHLVDIGLPTERPHHLASHEQVCLADGVVVAYIPADPLRVAQNKQRRDGSASRRDDTVAKDSRASASAVRKAADTGAGSGVETRGRGLPPRHPDRSPKRSRTSRSRSRSRRGRSRSRTRGRYGDARRDKERVSSRRSRESKRESRESKHGSRGSSQRSSERSRKRVSPTRRDRSRDRARRSNSSSGGNKKVRTGSDGWMEHAQMRGVPPEMSTGNGNRRGAVVAPDTGLQDKLRMLEAKVAELTSKLASSATAATLAASDISVTLPPAPISPATPVKSKAATVATPPRALPAASESVPVIVDAPRTAVGGNMGVDGTQLSSTLPLESPIQTPRTPPSHMHTQATAAPVSVDGQLQSQKLSESGRHLFSTPPRQDSRNKTVSALDQSLRVRLEELTDSERHPFRWLQRTRSQLLALDPLSTDRDQIRHAATVLRGKAAAVKNRVLELQSWDDFVDAVMGTVTDMGDVPGAWRVRYMDHFTSARQEEGETPAAWADRLLYFAEVAGIKAEKNEVGSDLARHYLRYCLPKYGMLASMLLKGGAQQATVSFRDAQIQLSSYLATQQSSQQHASPAFAGAVSSNGPECWRCHDRGHLAWECSANPAKDVKCQNCLRTGHYTKECRSRRAASADRASERRDSSRGREWQRDRDGRDKPRGESRDRGHDSRDGTRDRRDRSRERDRKSSSRGRSASTDRRDDRSGNGTGTRGDRDRHGRRGESRQRSSSADRTLSSRARSGTPFPGAGSRPALRMPAPVAALVGVPPKGDADMDGKSTGASRP